MKLSMTLSLILLGISASVMAADSPNYQPLVGKWQGSVTTNLKDAAGGGNPTQGEIGTSVSIAFEKKGEMLTGSSTVGTNPAEQWNINGDEYVWNDGETTVTTKRIPFSSIPNWVVSQAKVTKDDVAFAFKFSSCKVNKDNTPCKVGTHIPNGIQDTGIWLFTVKKNTLDQGVFYTYATGGKRILQQSLTLQGSQPTPSASTPPTKK